MIVSDEEQVNSGHRLNLPTTDTVIVLWQPDASTSPIVLCTGLSRVMTSSFCDVVAATTAFIDGSDPTQLLLTGGKAHAVKKILLWMIDCCAGYGLVDFPIAEICPVITAYEDQEAASMLGVRWLAARLGACIAQRSLPGGCIPPDEIAHKLKTIHVSHPTLDFLVNHVAEKTFHDNQTRFEQESAAKDAKRMSSASKPFANKRYNIASDPIRRQDRKPIRDGTAGSYSCRPKLPSDVYIPLRNAFVQPFGNAVNAIIQAKLKQAKDERHAGERARHRGQAKKHEEYKELEVEDDRPVITRPLSLQPGRRIGKRAAGKLDLAEIGVSHESFTGCR